MRGEELTSNRLPCDETSPPESAPAAPKASTRPSVAITSRMPTKPGLRSTANCPPGNRQPQNVSSRLLFSTNPRAVMTKVLDGEGIRR